MFDPKNLPGRKYPFFSPWPFYLSFAILVWFSRDFPFFWDAIQLGSQQGHWFFDNHFRFFTLPHDIDSGHPPLFGIYLALIWTIFGKSLLASHLSIFPFICGIIYQTFLLCRRFLPNNNLLLSAAVILVDPTVLAQSISVSPDIPLLFFFLVSLNQILSRQIKWLIPSLIFLALISMRGMMHVAILAVITVLIRVLVDEERKFWKVTVSLVPFVPAGIAAGLWLSHHYLETGWVGYHKESPWADSFKIVPIATILKNIMVLAWRMVDFGRIFIWLTAIVLVMKNGIKAMNNKSVKTALIVFLTLLLLISPNLVIHSGLLAHRYLLTSYLMFALLVLCIAGVGSTLWFNRIAIFLIFGLLTGNLWKYPSGVAQGWDSTLAQLPYHSMRKEMIHYIQNNKIQPQQVGSEFPNISDVRFTDLSEQSWHFVEKDTVKNDYIFYSNVINGFSDEDIKTLQSWEEVKALHSATVDVILYKNPAK